MADLLIRRRARNQQLSLSNPIVPRSIGFRRIGRLYFLMAGSARGDHSAGAGAPPVAAASGIGQVASRLFEYASYQVGFNMIDAGGGKMRHVTRARVIR